MEPPTQLYSCMEEAIQFHTQIKNIAAHLFIALKVDCRKLAIIQGENTKMVILLSINWHLINGFIFMNKKRQTLNKINSIQVL